MYTIPNTLQTALANGTPQRVLIEFTKKPNGTAYSPVVQYSNEDILVDTGVELDETFQSEEDFAVGGTPSAEIRFTMVNDAGQLKTFQFGTFTAWLGARIDSGTPASGTKTKTFTEGGVSRTYQFTPLGTFIAARPNIVSTKTIDVDANDQMTLFDVEMPGDTALNLTWPSTLGNLFVKMCNYVGVNYVSSTFTNSTLSVASRPKAFNNATMRDVLGWIAEAAGSVAKFDRDGRMKLAWFNTVNKTYTESDYSDFTPYRYETAAVNKLSVRKDGSEHVTGSGSNAYMILNNPFIGKNTNTAETNIYNKLNAAPTFHPASASLFTDWNIEAGDVVTVTNDSTNYSMPMYNVRLNWAGGTKVDAESTGKEKRDSLPALEKKYYGGAGGLAAAKQGEEWYVAVSDDVNSVRAELAVTSSAIWAEVSTISGQYAAFVIEANQIRQEVSDANNNYALFAVEANQLRSRVETAEGNVTELQQTASGLFATVSGFDGRITEVEVTSSGLFGRVTDAEGNIGTLQTTANTFRAEIDTANSKIASLEVATSRISLTVGTKNTTYRQWEDPRSAAGGSHTVIVGDRWIKTKGIDTWGDAALLTWDDTNDMQWHDAAGPLEYVWTGDATGWRLVTDRGTDLIVGAQLNVLDDRIQGIVRDADNNYSKIEQTASYIKAIVADNKNGLSSMILQEASQIRLEVSNEVNSIQSSIQINADRIGLIVDDESNQVKASVIVGIVNGSSEISLSANKIKFDGTTTVAGCFSVTSGVLYVEKEAIFKNSVSLYNNGRLSAGTLRVMGGENEYYDLNATRVSNLVADLRITTSGNSYVLQKKIIHDLSDSGWVDVGSFNRASALVGAWDRSTRTYTASATGAAPVSTTVFQEPNGNGQSNNMSVEVYYDNPTVAGNCLIKSYVYLVEDVSAKRVYAKWNDPDDLTNWANVSTADTYYAGYIEGADASVSISGSWVNNVYTAKALPGTNKTVSMTVHAYATGSGSDKNFSVQTYYGSSVNNVVDTKYVYLNENVSNRKIEAYYNQPKGTTGAVKVAEISASSIYNSVTVDGSWAYDDSGVFTYAASNGSSTKSTTIHLTTKRLGDNNTSIDHFPIWVYNGSTTANNIIERTIYLTEVASSARNDCRVQARWNGENGTIYGRVETGATYDAGASAVTLSGAWGTGNNANTYTVTASDPNNKTKSVTVHAYATGSGSDKNFSVQTYYGSSTNNVVDTKYVYLYENVSSQRIEAYYNQPKGTTGAVLVAQISASSIYKSVTLTSSWSVIGDSGNNVCRSVVATNGESSTAYIHMTGSKDDPSEDPIEHFPVWTYYGSNTSNCLIKREIYLTETTNSVRSMNRVNARWNGVGGTIFGRIDTSATFDKGAASVTLSDSWSNGTYTVTASNSSNNKKSTTVGLTANGQNDSATVYIYRDGNTNSTVKSENLYLVTSYSSTKANNKVDLRWHASSGTGSVLIGTAKDVDKIFDAGYAVTTSQIGFDQLSIQGGSTSISGRTQAGTLSKSNIQANGYIFFRIGCHGTNKLYYISVNP